MPKGRGARACLYARSAHDMPKLLYLSTVSVSLAERNGAEVAEHASKNERLLRIIHTEVDANSAFCDNGT